MAVIQLIRDEACSGNWNMAADEWLMHEAGRRQQPLLRTYGWSTPTLSLGYFQSSADRQQHPPSLGCPWVRRATGGGAILHDREVTYALAVPQSGQRGFCQALYDGVHQALVDELQARGVPATRHAAAPSPPPLPFLCFQRRAIGDVLLNGEKILGSAQRRSADAVVQHGSLLLRRSPLAPELRGLHDLTDEIGDEDWLIKGWLARIEQFLGGGFEPRSLADSERKQIHYAACNKFGTDRWRLRR